MRPWFLLAFFVIGCSSSSESPPTQAADDAGAEVDTDAGSLDDPAIEARYADFAKTFDEERASLGAPGAAVAILEHGKVTFAHGFGQKGPNDATPVRAHTLFRIGSMTKALTSTAAMQQVEAGKLKLDEKVTTYLPKLAINGTQLPALTVKHLLTHSSGLSDYLSVDVPAAQRADGALATFLESANFRTRERFMNPPGAFWNYSNPNFYIAGRLAELESGQPYRTLLSEKVFAPLGMTRTFFLASEVQADGDFARGKSTDADGKPWDVGPDTYENAWGRPAGYAFSSVLDYAKFVQFLYAGNTAVLSDAGRAELQKSQVDTLELLHLEHYGYGLFSYDGVNGLDGWVSTRIVAHGGDIPGYAADFYLAPASGWGVVILANADAAHFRKSVAFAMKQFGELPGPSAAPDTKVDPATFSAFEGDYLDETNVGHVHVAKSGDALTVSMPDVEAAKVPYDATLQTVSPGNFVLSIQGTKTLLTFVPDGTGRTTFMRTRFFVATRTTTTMSAPVKIDGAALKNSIRALPVHPLPL